MSAFDDVLTSNTTYVSDFAAGQLPGRAAKGLAVVTCMDARIDPLAALGLSLGDAIVLRNPGGRVTDDVLTSLILGVHLLGVERVMVIEHTSCKVASATAEQVHATILSDAGLDTQSLELPIIADQQAALAHDVQKVRSSPYIPTDVAVEGFLYDVATGAVTAQS